MFLLIVRMSYQTSDHPNHKIPLIGSNAGPASNVPPLVSNVSQPSTPIAERYNVPPQIGLNPLPFPE